MFSFANLPDLVIRQAVNYNIQNHGYYDTHIRYLAICSNWRHAALSLVYRRAYICLYDDGEDNLVYNSNIDLYLSTGNCSYARQLVVVNSSYWSHWPARKLGLFLDIFNLEPIHLPLDYNEEQVVDLCGKLDGKLLGLAESVFSRFVLAFSEIHDIKIRSSYMDVMRGQLYNTLVDAFASRLRGFETSSSLARISVNFSENLTSLSFKCDEISFPTLSRINSLPLQKLHLLYLPFGFSWRYFQKDPDSKESVVFPNLKDLVLDFPKETNTRSAHTPNMRLELDSSDNQVNVQFPRLRKLKYNNYSNSFTFYPEVILSHLDKVHIRISGNEFCQFSKLPIKSIGYLEVNIHQAPSSMADFRKAADHLFNRIESSSGTSVRIDSFNLDILNDVFWKNVTSLDLDFSDICQLVYMTYNMPQIEIMAVWELTYKVIEEEVRPYLLANKSRLTRLKIQRVHHENGIVIPISHFMDVLLSLKHLRKFFVGYAVCRDIMEQIQKNPEKFNRLKAVGLDFYGHF